MRLLMLALTSVVTMNVQLEAQTPPPAEQIAAAVLALPKEMRDGAGVMGYRTAGKLELLRAGKNGMLCLADDPAEEQFHVSCYADTHGAVHGARPGLAGAGGEGRAGGHGALRRGACRHDQDADQAGRAVPDLRRRMPTTPPREP
jgi:hypothetical protein